MDGKNYELEADQGGPATMLALGDYKAKLVKEEHVTAYRSAQNYELLFPDGRTLKFNVVGVSE